MSSDTLHIAFTPSGRGSLSEALKLAGKPDKVIGLGDDLSCGPISGINPSVKRAFVEDELGYDFEDDWFDGVEAFWREALDESQDRIVWFSRWSTWEYCGFLEWFRRNDCKSFKVVDLSHVNVPKRTSSDELMPIPCVSLVREETFCDNALWSLARPPEPEECLAWTSLWERLRSENAPLRAITENGLQSAPLDHFDVDLLKKITDEKVKAARVVGHVLADMCKSFREGGVYQCGDLLLFSRLRALVEQGVLKAEGDISESGFLISRP